MLHNLMQVATFVIAVLGLAVATSSLTWNVVQFLLAGSRPEVQLIVGALAPGGMVVGEPGPHIEGTLRRFAADNGYDRRVIGVRVINYGRTAARVQSWGIKLKTAGVSFKPLDDSIGPELPHVLEPGAQETWVVDIERAVRLASVTAATFKRPEEPLYGIVELSTGKALKSRKSVHVLPPSGT